MVSCRLPYSRLALKVVAYELHVLAKDEFDLRLRVAERLHLFLVTP